MILSGHCCLLLWKLFLFICLFWPDLAACRTLVPQPQIELMLPEVEMQSFDH